MVLESGVSVIFPLLGSVFYPASRFPPSGPIRVRFPALAGTSEMLCHLLSFRPHFVSFVGLVPPFRTLAVLCPPSLSRPPLAARALRVQAGALWYCGLPVSALYGGDQQASQVSGKTLTRMPCSLDPGGLPCLASLGISVLPS